MMKRWIFALGVAVGLLLAAAFWRVAKVYELDFEHFEDGSGRLTWCVPGELCKLEYGEW